MLCSGLCQQVSEEVGCCAVAEKAVCQPVSRAASSRHMQELVCRHVCRGQGTWLLLLTAMPAQIKGAGCVQRVRLWQLWALVCIPPPPVCDRSAGCSGGGPPRDGAVCGCRRGLCGGTRGQRTRAGHQRALLGAPCQTPPAGEPVVSAGLVGCAGHVVCS